MTTGKTTKRTQKTATNNTKETCIDTVKDAKDDNKEEEKVNDHDTPIHPFPTNGAHSEHFDPIPAENKSKNLATVDISK